MLNRLRTLDRAELGMEAVFSRAMADFSRKMLLALRANP